MERRCRYCRQKATRLELLLGNSHEDRRAAGSLEETDFVPLEWAIKSGKEGRCDLQIAVVHRLYETDNKTLYWEAHSRALEQLGEYNF